MNGMLWRDLPDQVQRLVYYERFVNNGSPTGLTFSATSSDPTSPLNCPRMFLLPFVLVPDNQVQIVGEEWMFAFEEVRNLRSFPIHPDLIPQLAPGIREQVVWESSYVVPAIPTASARTVIVLNRHSQACFMKLDYPLVLGRFPSDLSGPKLWIGPTISQYLSSIETRTPIYFLPEVSAIQATVLSSGNPSGALVRQLSVRSSLDGRDRNIDLIPAFSLFGTDRLRPTNQPVLASLLCKERDVVAALISKFVEPVIKSFWYLSLRFGLIPEAHAQNFLFGFLPDNDTPIVVWRDFQGFFRDASRVPAALAKAELGVYHLITSDDAEYARQQRSFLYDWILGRYFLDPIIECAHRALGVSAADIVAAVRELTHECLESSAVGSDYLPHEWYSMSLSAPQGQRLGLISHDAPKYR